MKLFIESAITIWAPHVRHSARFGYSLAIVSTEKRQKSTFSSPNIVDAEKEKYCVVSLWKIFIASLKHIRATSLLHVCMYHFPKENAVGSKIGTQNGKKEWTEHRAGVDTATQCDMRDEHRASLNI